MSKKFESIYIVTGGYGFIGSCFLREFVPLHPEILFLNLDNLSTQGGNTQNVSSICHFENYLHLDVDISNHKAMSIIEIKFLRDLNQQGCDDIKIIHFAAESHVDRSIQDPAKCYMTNMIGTGNMLHFARRIRAQKFLHVSTDEVFGSLEFGKAVEDNKYEPNSPYSSSKASSNLLVQAEYKTFGLNTVITNGSNTFGPFQDSSKFIPNTIMSALKNKPVTVYDEGLNIRDWLFVRDHARAIWVVLHSNHPELTGSSVNIGGNTEIKNIDLVRNILKLLKKPESLIEFVPNARPAHDLRYSLNTQKFETIFKARINAMPFEQMLEETVTWYVYQFNKKSKA
jgi:dTDP-glucose 4,6-dehydratase